MVAVQVEVVEVTDVIEMMADKHVHKDGEEVTREVTKEFRGNGAWFGDNICGRCNG